MSLDGVQRHPPEHVTVPLGFGVQTAAPTTLEYLPVGQSMHTELPLEVLYVPAGHASHPGRALPVKPALQSQALNAVLKMELAGQDEHSEVPLKILYVPDSQFMHALDPAAAEYAPAGQSVHTELPFEVLYVPVGHALQPKTGHKPSIPATVTVLIISISNTWEMCRYRPVSGVGHVTV